MKLSQYNLIRNYEGTLVFFNAVTCALAVVDENFMRVIEDIKNGAYDEKNYDTELIAAMKESGSIIEDDIDELQRLEFYRNLSKYDVTHLGLTIAPTLDCNFRCKYCFEKHPKGVMSEDTQAALIKFVENNLSTAKHFSVTWYGGEPLLTKNIIYSLSEKFLELCKNNSAEYDAFIVTNASLMTDEDVENFKKYQINGAQITIDGPKDIHDSRRRNITNESTFDYLIDRVNALLNNDIRAIVRINIDKNNLSYVDELLEILHSRIEKIDNLSIDFGQVSAATEICRSIENDCYNNEQYADIMLPLYEKVEKFGFTMNKMSVYPSPRLNVCCADYVTGFVVDNNGNIYRCWNHVGNTSKSHGNVNNFDYKKLGENYFSWIEWTPMRNEKCRDCNILPICMGGCPDAMRNSAEGQPVCGTIKYNLEKVLRHYYEKLKDDIQD